MSGPRRLFCGPRDWFSIQPITAGVSASVSVHQERSLYFAVADYFGGDKKTPPGKHSLTQVLNAEEIQLSPSVSLLLSSLSILIRQFIYASITYFNRS